MISIIPQKYRRFKVRRLNTERKSGLSRVEWEIDKNPLWFESHDAVLSEVPEAIACLCFAAASLKGYRIHFAERVCPVFRDNLKKLERIWQTWWGGEFKSFVLHQKEELDVIETVRGTALFLSLGVDSFFTLLMNPEVDTVVYVAGYDVELEDVHRLAAIERCLSAIGSQRGLRVIILRTNLRSHPVFKSLNWERFHGAALAAVGHLLADSICRVIISSSFPKAFFKPWGTSWETDFLWSSNVLKVEHFGEDLWRFEKLRIIADEPVVQKNLRICWENRNKDLNCGCCEKCLRTMLGLLSLSKLEVFPTLPNKEKLIINLKRIECIPKHLLPTYCQFLQCGLEPEVDAALRELMKRSGANLNKLDFEGTHYDLDT